MALRAVTLDAAGTLVALAEPVGETYARCAARHGIRAEPGAVEARFRRAFAAAPPLAFAGASPTRLEAHERAWWFALVREALGPAARGPALERAFADCWAHYARADAWRLEPDARAVLAALRGRGLALAVVSNSDARLVSVLDRLGVASALDTVVCSSRVGAAKPDPAVFRAALAALGAEAAATLHVGDSPLEDVEGARAAGIRAVLLDRDDRRPPIPPDVAVIASLARLPAIVDAVA